METGKLHKGRVERAEAMRGASVYPSEWGPPVGHPLSEERTRWVLGRVQEYRAHKRIVQRAEAEKTKADMFRRQFYLLLTHP